MKDAVRAQERAIELLKKEGNTEKNLPSIRNALNVIRPVNPGGNSEKQKRQLYSLLKVHILSS